MVDRFVSVGGLSIDLEAHIVRYELLQVKLAPLEYRLLAYLALHIGKAVSYETLLQAVWDYSIEQGGTRNQVKSAIRCLRRAIEPTPTSPSYILTVSKVGYRLIDEFQWRETRRDTASANS